jgi:Na+-transporting NADH:ubiquinone oxidoreductase subunit NqrF
MIVRGRDILAMRRIDYQGEEYLIHTRSGMKLLQALREMGIPATCDCDEAKGTSTEQCVVKWPKDTQFLLTAPTALEKKVLGTRMAQGYRLACQTIFK